MTAIGAAVKVEQRTYEFDATAVAGGTVGAFAAYRAADKAASSSGYRILTEAAGARIGMRMDKIPSFVGTAGGIAATGNSGSGITNEFARGVGAVAGTRAVDAAPDAAKALDKIAQGTGNRVGKAAARTGAALINEAPHVVGATGGVMAGRVVGRKLMIATMIPAGALIGGILATKLLPSVDISF